MKFSMYTRAAMRFFGSLRLAYKTPISCKKFEAVRKHSFRMKWILVDFLLNMMLYVVSVELDLVSIYIIFEL